MEIEIEMEKKQELYSTANDWLKHNRKELRKYPGEWIAFNNSGIIFHEKSGHNVTLMARKSKLDYTLKYVHPLEVSRLIRIVPIRIKALKNDKWQPDYSITLSTKNFSEKLSMLVDSGADISIIPLWTGLDLGLKVAEGELIEKAEGVNGFVEYVLRNLNFEIDGHKFMAPVGWVQTDFVEDILLGREVVFDIFDVEFKQIDEQIIFKKRETNS